MTFLHPGAGSHLRVIEKRFKDKDGYPIMELTCEDCQQIFSPDNVPPCPINPTSYGPGDVVPVRIEDVGIPRVEVFIFGFACGIFIGAIISVLVL